MLLRKVIVYDVSVAFLGPLFDPETFQTFTVGIQVPERLSCSATSVTDSNNRLTTSNVFLHSRADGFEAFVDIRRSQCCRAKPPSAPPGESRRLLPLAVAGVTARLH